MEVKLKTMTIKLGDRTVFGDVKEEGRNLILTPKSGVSMSATALEAIAIKQANPKVHVQVAFGDTRVPINESDQRKDVESRHDELQDKAYNEWAASPDGKATLARQAEKQHAHEAKVKAGATKTATILSKSRFKFSDDMAQITGFGGRVEQDARKSVIVGLDWLEKHPEKDIRLRQNDLLELEAIVKEHDPNSSAASLDAVMWHIGKAAQVGWEAYVAESRDVAAARRSGRG